MILKKIVLLNFCFLITGLVWAQQKNGLHRWQQNVKYSMDVDVDVKTNKLHGKQSLIYTNNSPDNLDQVFYHLYWNAFQPGSSMDNRSRELGKIIVRGKPDWDSRVKDRIQNLEPEEIGYQKIISLKMNGVPQTFRYEGTILQVSLSKPIASGTSVTFDMEFEAQVPLQIRRAGRDNPRTGVRYSMSQWYPKMAAYDRSGWHPTPYVAREFYGVWGDFDVQIHIDKEYKIGATGELMNAQEIGWGYDKPNTELKPTRKSKRTWHFTGKNIHDFVWAADPDYVHIVREMPDRDVKIHVIYNHPEFKGKYDSAWTEVADAAVKVLPFIEKNFGAYPYPQYSFIHGGDGGMEYAMATLVQSPNLGTAFHEWMHNWYQMILGTNESLYPWMDEGFTSYAEELVMKYYKGGQSALQQYKDSLAANPNRTALKNFVAAMPDDHVSAYNSYFALVKSGLEEPLTTHADHFEHNFAYSVAAYSKGEIFLEQLGYIVGAPVRDKILLAYYDTWKFQSPDINDFMKVAEDVSGIQLDWYQMYWVNSIKTIDYAIDHVWEENGKTKIRLRRIGKHPMPIDILVTKKSGQTEMQQIPLNLMYGHKAPEAAYDQYQQLSAWDWTAPTYEIEVAGSLQEIARIEIDPGKRMADIDRSNNVKDLSWDN